MSDRAALVASLPHGPRNPLAGTPPRPPGSVRRTTTIDQAWDDFGKPHVVTASGRIPPKASRTVLLQRKVSWGWSAVGRIFRPRTGHEMTSVPRPLLVPSTIPIALSVSLSARSANPSFVRSPDAAVPSYPDSRDQMVSVPG